MASSQHRYGLLDEEHVDEEHADEKDVLEPPSTRRLPRHIAFLVLAAVSVFALAVLAAWEIGSFGLPLSAKKTSDAEFEAAGMPPLTRSTPTGDKYLIGVGKADITGPVVEINFAGYASLPQKGTGLRQRLYSRAFIVGDVNHPEDRFVYLVIDTQSGDSATRLGILEGLKALGSEYDVYSSSNVALTGTHQHSGPGAWFNYLLPQVTSLGYSKQSYQAIVDGVVLSIKRAHESLTTGYLDVGTTNITDANLSRSLYAYLANPADERARYSDSTDKTMTVLRLQRESDLKNIGVLSWYAVHGTSMLENNTHVTGDNKGVAAYLFEKAMIGNDDAADGFVAGFSQANVGDTTPNVLGAWCDDGSGQMCTFENSTCGGKSETCHGRGPKFQALDLGVSSCYEIGRRQYQGALDLYNNFASVSTPVVGSTVKAFHVFQDMRYFNFLLPNGTTVQTCPAALGYSFAAGTSDGPGAFDFTQNDSGNPNASPVWKVISGLLHTPSEKQKACHGSKPILLDVGDMYEPYPWTPNIVDIQTLRVGQLLIVVSPSEASTMAGRRWRNAVHDEAKATFLKGGAEPVVVLGGPANVYAHYCVTPEEYEIQRYEGASTLFGKWQLPAYTNVTLSNLHYLAPDATGAPPPGPSPPDNRGSMLTEFILPVVMDTAPLGKAFGKCTAQPKATYAAGQVVNATFVGANPRNNLRLEGTYAAVEKQGKNDGTWTQVRSDADWSLVYTWTRTNVVLGHSAVTVSWESETDAEPGTYRLRYYGDAKSLLGGITAFEGTSNTFLLT